MIFFVCVCLQQEVGPWTDSQVFNTCGEEELSLEEHVGTDMKTEHKVAM